MYYPRWASFLCSAIASETLSHGVGPLGAGATKPVKKRTGLNIVHKKTVHLEFAGYTFRPLVPAKERDRISKIWVSHLICGHFSLQSCTHVYLRKEQTTALLSVQQTVINWTFTIMSCSKTLKFFKFGATEIYICISMYAVPLSEGRYTVIGKAAHEVIEWTTNPQRSPSSATFISRNTLVSYAADSSQREKSIKYLIRLCSIY